MTENRGVLGHENSPTITTVSLPVVRSWLLDATVVTTTVTTFGGVLLTTSAYKYGSGLLR